MFSSILSSSRTSCKKFASTLLIRDLFGKIKRKPYLKKTFCTTTIDVPADLTKLNDGSLTTPQIIQKYGYNAEVYCVQTRDGYTLQLHRIPKPGGEPFLLQHGLVDSSAGYVFAGPKMALSFYLSDLGYDVWLSNTRGNRYANEHYNHEPEKNEFWNFSLLETGYYDLSAIIDYVLSQTKTQQLHYVGHSTGTTIFWILCSRLPEYNNKIKLMHALAPIAYFEHVSDHLKQFLKYYSTIPETFALTPPSTTGCGLIRLDEEFTKTCLDYLFAVCGPNKRQLVPQMLPAIFGHIPAGCASKQIEHLLQLGNNKKFCDYDYGAEANKAKYGNEIPPLYHLKKVTCPTLLYYSQHDRLSTPEDVERLKNELGNCMGKYAIKSETWTHYDFMFGKDSRDLVYKLLAKNTKDYVDDTFEKSFE